MIYYRFNERQFDSIITDSSGDIEAEEVYGPIDEEEEERLYFESIANKKSNADTIFTPPRSVKQVKPDNSVILIEDTVELLLAGSIDNKEHVEASFSLGMDEWLGDLEVFDSIEEHKQLIVDKDNSSKVNISPPENPTFSLGMDDWWEDIAPKDLDTDFLTNNQPTSPPTEPFSKPSTLSLSTTTTTSTPVLSTPKELTQPTQLLPTSPSPICLPRKSIQIESFSSTFNSPIYSNKTTHAAVMTSSLNDSDSPLIIFADSREVSGSQILSSLRIKHNIIIQVYSLKQCSYVVSSRMAVDRQNFSDLSQPNSTQKIIDRARSMCELYERGSIIIEKDRFNAKLHGAIKPCVLSRNQLFLSNLARLCKSRLSVLYSGSEQNTIDILVSLSKKEAKRGHKIIGSLTQIDTSLFKFLCCIPRINPPVALGLATYLRNLDQLSSITPEELKKNCHGITKEQIDSIQKIFAHRFRSFALVQ
ncbi:Fanconi anemia group M protein-like [Oopsacas minuta]|uniref:Fanconi anemia group M protein-like n=1 Tax=Oopsacas minuta TaxID=111878 RepID=A0AAV7KI60_9METZ|nr:Fanconi anemia group M protein-like [Oopsacas minuta]